MNEAAARHRFWTQARRWTVGLLLTWLAANFAVPWFARDLDGPSTLGVPVAYGLAAIGLPLLYLLVTLVYLLVMDRLEARYLADRDHSCDEERLGSDRTLR